MALLDTALLEGGYLTAFQIRFHDHIPPANLAAFESSAWWIACAAILLLLGLGFYGPRIQGISGLVRAVCVGAALNGPLTAAAAFWTRGFAFPRTVLALGVAIGWILLLLWRVALVALSSLGKPRRVLIVGERSEADVIRLALLEMPASGLVPIGAVTPAAFKDDHSSIGPYEALLVCPGVTEVDKTHTASLASGEDKEVLLLPSIYDIMTHQARMFHVNDLPILYLPPVRLSAEQRAFKRAFDLVIGSLLVVITVPIALICAVAVILDTGLPVFYTQERVGERGRPFNVVKFRTMRHDAELASGPVLATLNDTRITRVGKWLRRLRFDELPQLYNVIIGDMSLVGPRPERPHFVAQFEERLTHYGRRHAVKPGLTGLAQVMGRYNTRVEDKLRMDLLYIYRYSPWRDLQIILQTATTVLAGDAADGISQTRAPTQSQD